MDSNKEVEFNLRLGDFFVQSGESHKALQYYYAAKEKNHDENSSGSIDTKINSIRKETENKVSYKGENNGRRLSFSWDIHYACNYRCPYCWWYGRWQHLTEPNRYLSIKELAQYWVNIYRKYGSARIEILGGEPFIYPNFRDLIRELSQIHTLSISTNLSTNIQDFAEQVNPRAVEITATFHPLYADFDTFVKKIILLQEKGFRCAVPYLAYPPQIKLLDYYRNKFTREKIHFNVLTFWGKYDSRDYPDAYTDEERKIIEPNLAQCGGENFQLSSIESPRGKLCYAGCLHACIHPDGETVRCGGGGYGGFNEVIGNFFDENFKLLDGPAPCPSDICPCNEWAFLLEEIVKKKMDKEVPLPKEEKEAVIQEASNSYVAVDNQVKTQEIKEEKIIEENRSVSQDSSSASVNLPRSAIPPYRVFWNWDMLYQCNYKCSYCNIIHGGLPCAQEQAKYKDADLARWREIWDRIFDLYHSCVIRLSGGEPTIQPVFYELVPLLLEKHVVVVTTNLSFDAHYFIEKIRPESLCITASFHPEFIKLEEFLEKAIFLHQKGYGLSVCIVSYPPFLEKIETFKEAFECAGFPFSISPFDGKFNGLQYPDSYNDAERKIMERVTGKSSRSNENQTNREWYEWKTEAKRETKGRLCQMGQMYGRILPNGDVTRCCVPNVGILGNIFEKDFKLLKKPQPCESNIKCPCFKAMFVGEEDNWLSLWDTIEHRVYKYKKENIAA